MSDLSDDEADEDVPDEVCPVLAPAVVAGVVHEDQLVSVHCFLVDGHAGREGEVAQGREGGRRRCYER